MIYLCPVPQASLLATNRMLQGTLLMQQPMQGNMRGLAVGSGPPVTSFLSEGARQSLLGPAPIHQVGLSSSGPYHSHAHFLNKDICVRKRENEQTVSAGGMLSSSSAEGPGERGDRTTSTEMEEAESDGQFFAKQEPEMKKQKMNGSEEPVNITIGQEAVQKSDNKMPTDVSKPVDISAVEYRGGSTSIQVAEKCCEESIASEHVLGVGTSLKVTIQQSSESRAFSTGLEELAAATVTPCGVGGQGEDSDRGAATDSYYCYICSIPYHNQQNFERHMNEVEHQQRMMEIQQVSNACLVNLLPRVGNSLQGAHKARGKKPGGVQRWCATCQTHFTGNLIEHRRTKEHKLSKQSSRPFCTVCKHHFRTPRKFVEHMKSREHKLQVEELREEGEPEVLEELITVDAVGCFEGEDDFEEETHEDEDSRGAQPGQRATPLEHVGDYEAFDSETQYGSSFVVPVAGFLCRLCHKFFYFESTARHFHCKSLMHFQNLQKYKALKNQKEKTRTYNRTVGDSPDLRDSRDNKEVIQVEKDCTNDCNMARDNTHPCGTSSTTIKMHPVVSTQDETEQDSISTATQQVSEQLDSDSVLPNTAVAVLRPCCCGTQPPSGSSSGLENMVKPSPCQSCQRSQPSLQEYGPDVTGEKSSCRGGCALALPAGQQDTNMRKPPRGSLLEREYLQQERSTLLMPHILELDEDRELINREEVELESSPGMDPGKSRTMSKRMASKTKSTRTTHAKT